MKPVEVVFVTSKEVSCNGTKDASTHPLVYLHLDDDGTVICPYCSKYFTIESKETYLKKFHEKNHK